MFMVAFVRIWNWDYLIAIELNLMHLSHQNNIVHFWCVYVPKISKLIAIVFINLGNGLGNWLASIAVCVTFWGQTTLIATFRRNKLFWVDHKPICIYYKHKHNGFEWVIDAFRNEKQKIWSAKTKPRLNRICEALWSNYGADQKCRTIKIKDSLVVNISFVTWCLHFNCCLNAHTDDGGDFGVYRTHDKWQASIRKKKRYSKQAHKLYVEQMTNIIRP